MKSRFIQAAYFAMLICGLFSLNLVAAPPIVLNDIHSKLNPTQVRQLVSPTTIDELKESIRFAKLNGLKISISGGRHSMGGQQFGDGNLHLDMSNFNKIIQLDRRRGIVEVQSGVQWPELITWLIENQKNVPKPWVIRQKQTGADRFSIGGAISSNIHGRGLRYMPFVQDIESFTLLNAEGRILEVSRKKNPDLFRLVVGGYGLFGIIINAKIRLSPRERLERNVELVNSSQVPTKLKQRLRDGYMFGDFQFGTDSNSSEFLQRGVFSFYKPITPEQNPQDPPNELTPEDWAKLLVLGHTDKKQAYDFYTKYYLSTDGYRYWSDTHQLSVYLDDYHLMVDKATGAKVAGSEMISEVYVPRHLLPLFLKRAAAQFRKNNVNVIYGTVRFIKKDSETFLPWAKKNYASIVFNFHVDHSPTGIDKVKLDYQRLFDLALSMDGNFFLTYHRWARRDQILKGYPQFVQFLKKKRKYDPSELFESDWYRHYRTMFSDRL